jgi:hypothetical protein
VSTHAETHPELRSPTWSGPRSVVTWSVGAGLVGLALLALGFAVDTRRAWYAYLVAWTFATSVSTGALVLLMVGHASKASWMVVTRRLTESIVDLLPLLLVLFVPLSLGLHHIYPWASPGEVDPTLRAAVDHRRGYLNPPFFVARSIVYLVEFAVVGALLRAWSRANDVSPRWSYVMRMRRVSGGALPLVALTITWASFDWTMSLEPQWYSTIFGLYWFAGAFVGAIALAAIMLHASRARGVPVTGGHSQALGRVLFAMVAFWAYMAFSQLLIQWSADIPAEVTFYRRRSTGSWAAVSAALVGGHFVAPFFLLLNRRWKRRTGYLASVGALLLFMHLVDVYWLIVPAAEPAGARPHWVDFAAILFVGGLSCAWVLYRYASAPPVPLNVPERAKGLAYEAAI